MSYPILITGASRGLGFALSEAFANGHHIVAVARTVGALEELDDRIQKSGGNSTLAPLDITDDGAMQHLCRMIHDRWGGVSKWIHTAIHTAPLTPADQIDNRDWQKSWETNVEATRRLIAYVSPLLPAGTGQAVFFEDEKAGKSFFGSYGATKAAQMALAKSWAAETRQTGPSVKILSPKPFRSATRARFYPGEDKDRLADPRDVAKALLAQMA